MFSEDLDAFPEEKQGIERYARNDYYFRQDVTFGEYADLPRRSFDSLANEQEYLAYLGDAPHVLFIDLTDIYHFITTQTTPGFQAIDIKHVAQLVCDYLGEDSNLVDAMWSSFDEEIGAEVAAAFGVDLDYYLAQQPFDVAMGTVHELANVVRCYLINAGYPMVDGESVYTVGEFKNGLLALRLKTYTELAANYG